MELVVPLLVLGAVVPPGAAGAAAGSAGAGSTRAGAASTRWTPTQRGHAAAPSHLTSARAAAAFAAAHPRTVDAVRPDVPSVGPRSLATARASGALSGSLSGASSRVAGRADTAPAPQVVASPNVITTRQWAGVAQVASGNVYPADPWVAANGTYVVQVVNQAIQVTDRNGSVLLTVPEWAFANALAGQNTTDARITWDATHNRWVGEILTFADDFSVNQLILVVSDGPDPTAGWTTYPITYSSVLPDFPSVASSSDKVVLGVDTFDPSLQFLGADVLTITWASIAAGAALTLHECSGADLAVPRAAQVLSAASDVHLISIDTATGDQVYDRITGAGDCGAGQYVDDADLSTSLGYAPFTDPPDPRQPGPDTLAGAVDGRPTDAVWMNGKLWWVSTFPVSYDGGTTVNDEVMIWGANTPASGQPTANTTYAISAGDGIDDFMGGIGLSRSGSLFVSYSESSTTSDIAWFVNGSVSGGALGTPQRLDASNGETSQDRWGDYAGVATDPIGSGTVWTTTMLVGQGGTWRTDIARLLIDTDNPSAAGAPAAVAEVSTVQTGTPVFRLAWSAASDASSGAVTYLLEESVDSGAWGQPTWVSSAALDRGLTYGHTYRFRVTAYDVANHAGPTTTGTLLVPGLAQTLTTHTGTWHTQTSPSFSGGGTWYSSAAGATATYTNTGLRSLAVVATKATSRGSFKVYIDGVYKATVSCYATTTAYRQVVYQITWSNNVTHTIKIVIVGTAGHPRVDIDAFIVLK